MNTLKTASKVRANLDKLVFRIAGIFILISLALSQLHDNNWLWFTAFVGANLLQASFTGLCPLASLLRRIGIQQGPAFGTMPITSEAVRK